MLTGGGGGGGGRGGRAGQIVRSGNGSRENQIARADNQIAQQFHMQPFSGGISKSERMLCAGTDGSVAEIEANIEQAVRQFGAAPGAKKMMDGERIAAEEAIQTGLYGVWRNASCGSDFCGRVGAAARCFCGHDFSDHKWSKGKRELRPACTKCACRGFTYIPRRPEEVGEYWLPRRRGFDVNIWRAKCKCGHSHEDHDPNTYKCRCCSCPEYHSAWLCTGCDGKWEDHETLFESEEERRLCNRPVGQAFMPLASTPAIQEMVFDDSARGEGARSHSLPHRPRPERSVKLMRERCDNYGGRNATRAALQNDNFGSLEDAFPPRGGSSNGFGSLEDAFPSRQGGGLGSGSQAMSSLEDAFPPRNAQRGAARLPPRPAGGQEFGGRQDRPLIRRSGSRPNSSGSRG